ncbi:F0F1 ATP synthase subunit delta [Corynebacterium frankenforstense]|uniref:F0F1 ATP synthase subunit delta n=1 Tax=Corynebacterium frankenforstense TaxID=1230998 RepID=UPI00254B5D22|nr:F0F1 ATP synthase subunit delta [Corynebacterium frankenforstense]MDK6259764.1 F0F1 ATP synthase subunit delta [Corynebacterium frankenforstense]
MHAASRDALSHSFVSLDAIVGDDVAAAATTGTELFEVVELLDGNRQLRVALADQAVDAESRSRLVDDLFGGKVAGTTLDAVKAAAGRTWSTPRQFRTGLVAIGRRAIFRAANAEGQLGQVEDELFQLARLLEREPRLTQLLSDATVDGDRRRSLAASVLYGKVSKYAEALVLQVVGRPEHGPVDDVDALVAEAAEFTGREVAHVVSAGELDDRQRQALAEKLGRVYGRDISVHTQVDESLLGGATVKVGDERIDGSLRGRLDRLRAQMV